MNKIIHDSPVGPLTLISDDDVLVGCYFNGSTQPKDVASVELSRRRDALLDSARRQLDEYFAKGRERFDLKVAPRGTEFQKKVWSALQTISFGQTKSYRDISVKIGKPTATRAVGAANGANPICIIIPCHRVIGANGSLTGFGGGLERKSLLLELESAQASLLA